MYIPIWKVPFKLFHTAIGYIYYLSISLHAGTLIWKIHVIHFQTPEALSRTKGKYTPSP